MTERTSLRLERDGSVAELVLVGPGKGNALGPAFWREMPEALAEVAADDAIRVLILRGDGANFTYGLDLMAMMGELGPLVTGPTLAPARTELLQLIRRMQEATEGLARLRKPVVAAVHGWCIGGGLDLISACDVRLCSADARFSLREVKVAITPDLGALQRLPGIIGQGHTRELAYTGGNVDAERAAEIGLVNRVLPDDAALLGAARALAREMAANPPLVVQGIKQVLEHEAGRRAEEGLRYVALWNAAFLQSEDLAEAFAAFAEGRPPQFKGR